MFYVCLVFIYAAKSTVPIGTICAVGHPEAKGQDKIRSVSCSTVTLSNIFSVTSILRVLQSVTDVLFI